MDFEQIIALDAVRERKPTVLAIGVFDGVHKGHQALLQMAVEEARLHDMRAAALTFYPHPREVISGEKGRYYLMSPDERATYIAAQGIELMITHPFDADVQMMRAEPFVDRLCEHLDVRQLWGGNFSLGYQREGDFDFLSALGQQKGFTVHQVEPCLLDDGERVSSSLIRRKLVDGDVRGAADALGRPYSVTGEVMLGQQLGRTIGVPTANVEVWAQNVLPCNGVYATRICFDAEPNPDSIWHMAATNVGVRPTVSGDQNVTIEVHILDFERDIYGEQVTVQFIDFIRTEKAFAGLDELKTQIAADIQSIRSILTQTA